MRFSLVAIALAVLPGALGFVGPTCLKLKDSLGNKPDQVLEQFNKQVCAKGCKPVIADYDRYVRKNLLLPAINEISNNLNLPRSDTNKLIKLADQTATVVKQKCAPSLGKTHLCADSGALTKFGKCLKDNLLPVVMSNIGDVLPLLSEPNCQKFYQLLQGPLVFEKIIPTDLVRYSKVCKALGTARR